MTPTQQFIEDAIAGGWGKATEWRPGIKSYFDFMTFFGGTGICLLVLDPLAWQAVGKTRGWSDSLRLENIEACPTCGQDVMAKTWRYYLHRFIDHLADGKTIDEALAAISQGV